MMAVGSYRSAVLSGCALVACIGLSGCGAGEPAWSTYEEVNYDTAAARARTPRETSRPAMAAPASPVRWTVPDGWRQEAASGMRLATFAVGEGAASATCTVVSLGGAAGGLDANVRRWIGQLNLPVPPAEAFDAFLERQDKIRSDGGFEGVLVDLTELEGQPAGASSMIAALLTADASTLFVKMTGPIEYLKTQKEALAALCRSMRRGD